MPVLLETHRPSLHSDLLRLFDGVAPTGSPHISQRARLADDLPIGPKHEAPEGTLVLKDHRGNIRFPIPRDDRDDATLLWVTVRPDDLVVVKDSKK